MESVYIYRWEVVHQADLSPNFSYNWLPAIEPQLLGYIYRAIAGGTLCSVTGSAVSTVTVAMKYAEISGPAECFDAGRFIVALLTSLSARLNSRHEPSSRKVSISCLA